MIERIPQHRKSSAACRTAIGFLTGILLAAAIPAAAQTLTSRVEGTVQDETGGVLPGASVTMTEVDTAIVRETVTNEIGLYLFPQVPPGTYRVEAALSGFRTTVIEDVRVALNAPTSIDIVVEVGALTQTVVVTASAAQSLVNAADAAINTNLSREQVRELPLSGRSVVQLALTQAGVTGRGGARTASINGTRGTFNNYTLDGVNNQDAFIRTDALFGIIPLKESFIDEISITTANSDVDAGLGASQTQFVTRSGSNAFSTEAFFYHRNESFNATNFFNKLAGIEKERIRVHEFGFNIGGPIIRDKFFFFVNYEEEREPRTTSVVRTVLTDSARSGDFSYVRQDNGQIATVNLFELTGITPDPVIGSLVGLTPGPNDTSAGDGRNTAGYRFNSPGDSNSDWLVVRGDYVINPRHSATGSFHQFRQDSPNDVFNDIDSAFPGLPGAGQGSTRRLASFAVNSTLGPGILNEARFGFQAYGVGFANNESFPDGYRLSFGGFTNPVRNFLDQGRDVRTLELSDNVTWIQGDHTFKVGGGARWTRVDSFNDAGLLPTYSLGFGTGYPDPLIPGLFPGGISSDELDAASTLLATLGGIVDEVDQTFNVVSTTSGFVDGATERRVLTQNFYHLYAGDTWRLAPETSLTLGLRWEFHSVPDEAQGLALLPVGGVEAVLDPNAIVDLAGSANGRPFFNNDWNNFAPNVGVAHQLTDKMVLRGGYALNYVLDNNLTTASNAVGNNAGLSQPIVLPGLGGTVSGGGLAPVPAPEFKIPRTARDGILADSTAALFTFDPDMRTPFVQQWNAGLQYQLLPNTAIEVRYVGNRGTRLVRAIDLNQLLLPEDFVEDFRRAQRNLAANGDPRIGEPLQVFPRLGLGGFLQSGGVQNWIRNGEIGQYIGSLLAPNRVFFFAGEGGERFGATLPASYFYVNPNTFVGDVVGNNAYSQYNALQIEVRRTWRFGFTGQFNYTWGQVMTDFSGTGANFRGLFDNAQPDLEIMRPDYDITHTLNGNWVWEIPAGEGRRWLDNRGVLSAIVGGWDLTGFVRIRSGETINIISARGTINRGGSRALTNTVHLTGISVDELQNRTGAYRHPDGRVTLFDSGLLADGGGGNPDFFRNPDMLEAGSLPMSPISGPWYATLDIGLRKNIPLAFSSAARLQLRVDFFNILNRTNFNVSSDPGAGVDGLGVVNRHNPNSTEFGLITDAFSAREIQVGLKLTF